MAQDSELDWAANRFVAAVSPEDPYLSPPEPRPPRSEDKPDGRRRRPTDSQGRVATAFGRLTPEEARRLRRAGKLNAHGALAVPPVAPATRVALTLEEFMAHGDRRRELELEAAARRHEQAAGGLPRQPVARSDLPAGAVQSGKPGHVPRSLPEPEEALDEACRLLGDHPAYDWYAALADRVLEPDDAEEELAWELAHELEPGTLASERRRSAEAGAERARTHPGAHELATHETHRGSAAGDELKTARCANPCGCSNEVQGGRGTRCRACYAYRRRHGTERPLALVNRERRRLGLLG